VFKEVGSFVLDNALNAFNCSVFAYGQTGSGKSYSMMGTGGQVSDALDPEQRGLIPRICEALFERIDRKKKAGAASGDGDDAEKGDGGEPEGEDETEWTFSVTYLEIYRERVYDLLSGGNQGGGNTTLSSLKVREHPTKGAYAEGLMEKGVSSYDDIERCIFEGSKARTVASTNMNLESSRSHAVFTVIMKSENKKKGLRSESRVRLVDLAGSERAKKSGATGERLKEGSDINKSLSSLSEVIKALANRSETAQDGQRTTDGSSGETEYFIPYRNSTLTWLLKDSLGGNAKTVMLATVSPADYHYEETMSTLKYVERAKKILSNVTQNQILTSSEQIAKLKKEVEMLKAQLQGAGLGDSGGISGSYGVLVTEIKQANEKFKMLRKKSESDLKLKTRAYKQTIEKLRAAHEIETDELRKGFLDKMNRMNTLHGLQLEERSSTLESLKQDSEEQKGTVLALQAEMAEKDKRIEQLQAKHSSTLEQSVSSAQHARVVSEAKAVAEKGTREKLEQLRKITEDTAFAKLKKYENDIGSLRKEMLRKDDDFGKQKVSMVQQHSDLKEKLAALEGMLEHSKEQHQQHKDRIEQQQAEEVEQLSSEHEIAIRKIQEEMQNTLMGTVSTMRQEFNGEMERIEEQGQMSLQEAYNKASERLENERVEHRLSEEKLNDTILQLSEKVKELLNKLVDAEKRHQDQVASWEERLLSAQMQTAQAMNFQVAVARGESDISWVTKATEVVSNGIKRYTGREAEDL
jgi:hypothetical protein